MFRTHSSHCQSERVKIGKGVNADRHAKTCCFNQNLLQKRVVRTILAEFMVFIKFFLVKALLQFNFSWAPFDAESTNQANQIDAAKRQRKIRSTMERQTTRSNNACHISEHLAALKRAPHAKGQRGKYFKLKYSSFI